MSTKEARGDFVKESTGSLKETLPQSLSGFLVRLWPLSAAAGVLGKANQVSSSRGQGPCVQFM